MLKFTPVSGTTKDTLHASTEAALAIEPKSWVLRGIVLNHIKKCGAVGATDEEMQVVLHMRGNTQRPRRWELHKGGLIKPAGHRINKRGLKCTVWVAK